MARGSPPAYVLIEDHLRKLISAGKPGHPLPSDSELCQRFGVSRMTARQAVMQLAAEHLLYRVSGSGTFIAQPPPVHRRMNRLLSFTEEMRRRGLTASSRILAAGTRKSTDAEAVALRLAPGDRVAHLRRLRMADDIAMAIETVVLPANCAAVLAEDLATGSLHEALRAIGRTPVYAQGQLTAVQAGKSEAALLDVPVGGALLVERRTIEDTHGIPVEHTETRYVGERYVFDLELESPPDVADEPGSPVSGRTRKAAGGKRTVAKRSLRR